LIPKPQITTTTDTHLIRERETDDRERFGNREIRQERERERERF